MPTLSVHVPPESSEWGYTPGEGDDSSIALTFEPPNTPSASSIYSDARSEFRSDSRSETTDIFDTCPKCQSEYLENKANPNTFACGLCGFEFQTTTTPANIQPIRFGGNTSKLYRRQVYGFGGQDPNYREYTKTKCVREIISKISRSGKGKISNDVVVTAINLFYEIKVYQVYRVNCRLGVIGACLYYACIQHGCARTPATICEILGIEEKFLSAGIRELRSFNNRGVINIPTSVDPLENYISRYIKALDIDRRFEAFAFDLIKTAEEHHIHVLHDSRNNTKAVGAIYVIVLRVPRYRHITKEMIEKKCGISKTTFVRYTDEVVFAYPKIFRNCFKRHQIPMPNIWRVGKAKAKDLDSLGDISHLFESAKDDKMRVVDEALTVTRTLQC